MTISNLKTITDEYKVDYILLKSNDEKYSYNEKYIHELEYQNLISKVGQFNEYVLFKILKNKDV